MKTIDLGKYKPTISSPEQALEIYNQICAFNPKNNEISIELKDIVTMTTRCAKIIFGFLYLDLGADCFYKNIVLNNCSDGLYTIIEFGIEHAITQGR